MRRSTVRRWMLASLLLAGLAAPTSARADQGVAVIHDCLNHGRIVGHYSQKAYSEALSELPADVTEYSNCAGLIREARLAAASRRSHQGGGSGPPAAITPSERQQLNLAHLNGGAGVHFGGEVVHPGVVDANVASAVTSLPTPLLALVAALAAAAVIAGGSLIHNRVRTRGRD